jgi:hypothetical protein
MDPFITPELDDAVSAAVLDCPGCDAEAAFAALPRHGAAFPVRVAPTLFTGRRAKRYLQHTYAGENRSDNHLQGVQRYRDFLYFTAGDMTERVAHLFVSRLECDENGVPIGGEVAAVLCIDDENDHPGGMQRLGNVLAIAMEGRGDSSVVFLQLDDPLRPAVIRGATIRRPGLRKASAAALTRLPDGRVLAGVCWYEARLLRRDRAWLDLYLSAGTDLRNGWQPARVAVDVRAQFGDAPPWQSIAFLDARVAAGDDGASLVTVYLLGLRNTKQSLSNYVPGKDLADQFRLTFPAAALDAWGDDVKPVLAHIDTDRFMFDEYWGNFSAAAGIDVEDDRSIALYGAHHWRIGERLRVSVCRA